MELGDLTKKAIVIGTLSAISAFGGMRYNEYRNAMRPFNVVEKSGVYVLKDKLNNREMPAEKASNAYQLAVVMEPTLNKYGSALHELIGEEKK